MTDLTMTAVVPECFTAKDRDKMVTQITLHTLGGLAAGFIIGYYLYAPPRKKSK